MEHRAHKLRLPLVELVFHTSVTFVAVRAYDRETNGSRNSNKGYGSVKNKFNQRIRRTVVLDATGNATVNIANFDPDLLAILGGASNGSKVYLQVHTHSDAGQKSNPVTGEARLLADPIYTIIANPEVNSEVIEGSNIDVQIFVDGLLLNPANLTVTPSRADVYNDVTFTADTLTIELATGGAPGPFSLTIADIVDPSISKILNYYYVEA